MNKKHLSYMILKDSYMGKIYAWKMYFCEISFSLFRSAIFMAGSYIALNSDSVKSMRLNDCFRLIEQLFCFHILVHNSWNENKIHL